MFRWKREYRKMFKGLEKEQVWKLWSNVEAWPEWHGDLEYCTLEGPFAVGAHFMLKPRGMDAVKIAITEINPGRSFTDCTTFFGAKMFDTHAMIETPSGLELSNTLEVRGPLAWLWVYLVARHVAHTVPEEMEALAQKAARVHHA